MKNIIVQCGGMGTRMGRLTTVKPKALIPIDGKPLIFHLIDNNPDSKFILIVDHLSDVLIKYVSKYRPKIDIKWIFAKEKTTASGIYEAASHAEGPFFVVWSDLYIKSVLIEPITDSISVGITNNNCYFPCRWSVKNNELIKEDSTINGVAGIFYFKHKKYLSDIDESKSLTSFLKDKNFNTFDIENIDDIGTEERFYFYHKNNRFFNKLIFKENEVEKCTIIKEYQNLLENEINWYEVLKKYNFKKIPKIINKNPFIMEKIKGDNPFNTEPSRDFILNVIDTIKTIHELEKKDIDIEELKLVYLNKTLERVYEVFDLIPFINEEYIKINDKKCSNPFHIKNIDKFKKEIETLYDVKNFTIIHGDCTFSNIIRKNNESILIDPRGYFGKNKIYGDPRYDWAKLYYSFVGNYDNVNSKKYSIKILNDNEVFLSIDTNAWEKFESDFFSNIPYTKKEIELLHILIWFSLCGYVKEDYSSILLSYYNALQLWNKYCDEYHI